MTRTYLEWLVELPWAKTTEDHLDIDRARQILDEDHYGLEKIKKRIIEYLAVRRLKPDKKGPILCLVGPPGVGKTSTGRSVARALGREFVRVSLGGVRDEAEIRGHRRTYVGALPGPHPAGHQARRHPQPGVRARRDRQAGQRLPRRPVVGAARGARPRAEPHLLRPLPRGPLRPVAGAVLRHRQRGSTRSRRRCGPAGDPRAARLHAKREAAHRQAPPDAQAGRRSTAWRPSSSRSPTRAILEVIDSYTREAGVRNLEREIASVLRSVSVKVASGQPPPSGDRQGPALRHPRPGPASSPRSASAPSSPGVATGLAWTPVGGEILFVEATRMRGNGQADPHRPPRRGDEGVGAGGAHLRPRPRRSRSGLEADFFANSDLHIHVPAGATRKDGPSAGVTMVDGAGVAALRTAASTTTWP